MAHLNNSQIGDLLNANSEVKSSIETRWKYVENFFKPGTLIYWTSSGRRYRQSGSVIRVIGSGSDPRIRCSNLKTGRTVDVSLYDIDWDRMISQANIDAEMNEEKKEEAMKK
jgi:hypothetical protein